ncbi:hypothetical protein D9758_017194 [Tetrapyrgos nigripes]|uniref:Peptidase C14 caspase domain-containing protein n=1 Tax=Tetrapyrgos nigripes TaxID=182062 RepID=A0A8H5C083_9AGAR|nr:hypothetical protein D9758_017194 [Tetrapyrgos nigripes]
MLLSQHNVTVHTVSELLWYLQRPSVPSETSPESVSNAERDVSNSLQDSSMEILEGDLSQLGPSPPRIISIDRPRSSLFALIIGIDEYLDRNIKNLSGAVADADSVRDFLLQDVGVPQEQIKNLRNSEATRLAIETEIQNLSGSSAIKENTPILIFYAGHGAQMPAGDLPARDGKIQMLVPYDFALAGSEDERGQGVLDVRLSSLLADLTSKKGDNITCIFDSCHSGSGTRGDEKDHTFAVRSIELPQSYTIPPSIFPSHSDLESSRISAIAKGSENVGLQSHVLLTACLPHQEAKERHGAGAFTSALLTLLREQGLDQLTYRGVIANLPDLPLQNPQCEGVHQDRVLFNSKVPSPRCELYPVKRSVDKPGHFMLQAGEAHGITAGAEFDIYSDKDMTSFICSVYVSGAPSCFNALCTIKPEAKSSPALLQEVDFPESAYALQTRAGVRKPLRVSIPLAEDFIDVFRLIASDMQSGDNAILLVDSEDEQPDLIVSLHSSPQSLAIAHFKIMSLLCRQHGFTRMPFDIPLDGADSAKKFHHILRSAAHFYDHLHCSANSKSEHINEGTNIEIDCFQLKDTGDLSSFEVIFAPDPEGKNLNIGGVLLMFIITMRFFAVVSALAAAGFATAQESARFGSVAVSPCGGFKGGNAITLTYNATTAIQQGNVPESVSFWVQGVNVTDGVQTPVSPFFRLAHNDNFDSQADPIFTTQITVPEPFGDFINAPFFVVTAFIIHGSDGLVEFGGVEDECPQIQPN